MIKEFLALIEKLSKRTKGVPWTAEDETRWRRLPSWITIAWVNLDSDVESDEMLTFFKSLVDKEK